ncbi:MAG: class I SAM-dependent methyltransferase [Thermodesulfobacteriota bacterium]
MDGSPARPVTIRILNSNVKYAMTESNQNTSKPGTMYSDGSYQARHPTWHEEDSCWKADQICRIIESNSIRFNSYVDIGCGAGRVLHELSLRYPSARFHGYDISPHAIAMAKKYETERVSFHHLQVFPPSGIKCDVAAVIDLVEHIEDYLGFLRKLRELANYFIFHIPLEISVEGALRDRQILARRTSGHLHYFTKATALAALDETGYEVIDSQYTPAFIDLARTPKQRLARVVTKLFFRLKPDLCVRLLGGASLMVLARPKEVSFEEYALPTQESAI